MTGHEPLIAMRKAGQRPEAVFLDDFESPTARDWHEPGKRFGQAWPMDYPTVAIAKSDNPRSLDLRFVVGLQVHISSPSEGRAKALFERAKQCGAAVVAAAVLEAGIKPREQSGWMEIWHRGAAHG